MNAINNAGKYESNFTDIYPEELELCRQNGSNAEATFLDLDIKIKNSKSQIGFFDERESFLSASLECQKNPLTFSLIYFTYQLELNV